MNSKPHQIVRLLATFKHAKQRYLYQILATTIAMNAKRMHIRKIIEAAETLENQSDLEDAEDTLLDLVQDHPDSIDARRGLALFYWRQRRGSDAFEHLKRCSEMAPSVALYPHHMGSFLRQEKQLEDAEAALFRVLEIDPTNQQNYTHRALYLLGVIYQDAHSTQDAYSAYEASIQINPRFTPPYHHFAQFLLKENEPERALQVLQEGLQHKSNDVFLLVALIDTYTKLRNFEEAGKIARRTRTQHPNDPYVHASIGEMFLAMGDMKKARPSFNQVVRLDAKISYGHLGLGLVHIHEERFEAALKPLQKALELNSQDRRAYKALSAALFELGRYSEASRVDLDASKLFAKDHMHTLTLRGFDKAPWSQP